MKEEFLRSVKEDRQKDAAEFFYQIIEHKSLEKIDDDLEIIDVFLNKVLPFLIKQEPVWLIRNPVFTSRYLALVASAFEKSYHPSDMIYHAMHLRCFLAIADAFQKDVQGVHKEVLYAADAEIGARIKIEDSPPIGLEEILKPNRITASILAAFFKAYFEYLKETGKGEIVERIEWIIKRGIIELEREETRPGVVRGLFVNEKDRKGAIKNILVSIEEGDESIEYSHLAREKLGESLRDAADVSRKAAHKFLSENGYVEGLCNRKVIWQIVRTDGKAEDINVFYDGASICLPLTIAIISYYVGQPVASDIAMTGMFNIHSAEEGRIIGVAGIQQKIEIAIESGIKKVFLPLINKSDLRLAYEKRAQELNVEFDYIDRLQDIYRDLFYKPKLNSFSSIARDIWNGTLSFLHLKKIKDEIEPEFIANRRHIWISSWLYALLFILDGVSMHFIYGKTRLLPAVIWAIIGTVIVLLGLVVSYVLPTYFLERGKRNSWIMGIVINSVCVAVVFLIFLPMIPFTSIDMSKIFDWPPVLAIMKDFVIYLLFATLYLTNLYNYKAGLNFLARRRQFISVRNSLKGQEEAEFKLPSTVIRFGWNEGFLFAAFFVVFLLIFEMYYYFNLSENFPQGKFVAFFGISRDLIFIILGIEVLAWYRNALVEIRRATAKFLK